MLRSGFPSPVNLPLPNPRMPESHSHPIVVQMPAGVPAQLVLLFHGVGGQAGNLLPLGRSIAAALPRAAVLSVPSPAPVIWVPASNGFRCAA